MMRPLKREREWIIMTILVTLSHYPLLNLDESHEYDCGLSGDI